MTPDANAAFLTDGLHPARDSFLTRSLTTLSVIQPALVNGLFQRIRFAHERHEVDSGCIFNVDNQHGFVLEGILGRGLRHDEADGRGLTVSLAVQAAPASCVRTAFCKKTIVRSFFRLDSSHGFHTPHLRRRVQCRLVAGTGAARGSRPFSVPWRPAFFRFQ